MSRHDELVERIVGLPPLRGPEPRLRVTIAPTWEPVVFITVIDAGPTLSLSVITPGPKFVQLLMKAATDDTAIEVDPSRRVYTGRVPDDRIATLSRHLHHTAWALGDREPTGMDGLTVTTDVYDPARSHHRASQWWPPTGTPMAELMLDAVDAAGTVDPSLLARRWVQEAQTERSRT